ncbi:alpha-rhamnosidase [Oenococcus sp. UCMA 17063]|nr:alpha-rhamnosidase [Oenococcus sp. UCMA 17063]
MVLKFQIGNNVKFNHDSNLLRKAVDNLPVLNHAKVKPVGLVDIKADKNSLHGFKAVSNQKEIEKLSNYSFKKGEKFVLDFGNHQVGHFSINIDSSGSPMDAPLFLHITFAETPAEIGIDAESYNGWLSSSWISEEYLHLDVLPTRLAMPRRYAFRYVEIEVKDSSPKWSVVFDKPEVITESAVSIKGIPELKIDDPELKKIDEVGIKTLRDCMQEVFEDGPKRDHRLWLGDLRLQALTNYETFDNPGLVKRCLYLFGGMSAKDGRIPANVFTEPFPIPDDTFMYDYGLFFISVLFDYFNHFHDKQVLKDLYQVAKKEISVSVNSIGPDGIFLQNDEWPVFVDWSENIDKQASGQAILIYVLKQFSYLAKEIGDPDYSYYQELTRRYTKTAIDHFYDPEQELFVSGSNKQINIASQSWMILAHVFDDEKNYQLMKNAINQLFPIKDIATPYMYHHIAAALFESSHKKEGINLIKSYWGKMIDLGADTFWESFEPENPEFSPYGSPIINSYCHAWSCTPSYLIRKYLVK